LLLELTREVERARGLLLHVMAAADDVALDDGARNVADWLAARTHADYGPRHRDEVLAESLDRRWGAVAHALREGRVNTGQAEVITRALDALGSDVDADLLVKAERHLLEQAELFGPRALRVMGRKVLEVIAPDLYEDDERRRLEAEERRAAEQTSLVFRETGDGSTDVRLRLPDASAARLRTYLEAFAAPRRAGLATAAGGGGTDDVSGRRVPHSRLLGEAFCSLLELLDPARLPAHGGAATTVVVTMSLDQLQAGLGAAGLATGGRISAGEARRLACTASLVPAVLGGRSEPLDLGRTARLFSPAQRKAMALRDGGCRADGCSIPAAWCEAHHHRQSWSRGGRTDLADGQLLCSWHHHRAHDDRYLHQRLPNGDLRFRRRP
jgi:hypothetical protein